MATLNTYVYSFPFFNAKEYKIENTDVHVTTVLSDKDAPVSPNEVTSGIKVSSNALKVKDLSTDA